ncbi:MAG TPA: PEP-CTERM sorting domain-containing protein [Burkholderiaceae bacterium]|nr:PEP-CTERM sorting domain-containing protein [Burkholderiaceae bacterium]HQR70256.1 PEP-CTERM sorting domain-containing protein [Burkholderiaceae bacterium]
MKRVKELAIFVALWLCIPLAATATVIFDSGAQNFFPTGTQFGRVTRDGNPSVWGVSKPFPGVVGAPTARGYELFTVNSGAFNQLQITLDDPTFSLFVVAYLNSFNPVNSAPNYGLDVNYLGDAGFTQPFGNPSVFQIDVALNSLILLSINEINPGAGRGQPLHLIVEGFAATTVPEPSTLALLGLVVSGLALARRRKLH